MQEELKQNGEAEENSCLFFNKHGSNIVHDAEP